jgi:DNA-binding IclR family transcriptional regulator
MSPPLLATRAPARRGAGTVSALERGIAVLRCFEPGGGALRNGELARRTGIPKPTLTRLAATLVSLGLLKHARADDRYELAAGVPIAGIKPE